jgi:Asp-tRNA(Asn)/Glu-tRNA(Gln) amidotransferase A subunit family amidase
MARTVADLKLLFEIMQGPDPGDPSAAPVPVRWPQFNNTRVTPNVHFRRANKPRIGFFDEGTTPVTPETRDAVNRAAQILRAAGFEVEPFRPDGLEKARQLWWKFFGVAGGMLLGPMTIDRESELSPILKEFNGWVAAEPSHTAQSLLDTWIERDLLRMQIFEQMQKFPVLLCPVAAVPAFRHGERRWQIDGKQVEYLDAWSYCEWFNLLGMPAATVPISRTAEGLPIGVQIAAQPWEEELVLSIAEMLQEGNGKSEIRRPPPEI